MPDLTFLLDFAAFALNPANSDPDVLIAVACVAASASGLAVLGVLARLPRNRRHSLDQLRNPDHNPAVDGTIDYIRRTQ